MKQRALTSLLALLPVLGAQAASLDQAALIALSRSVLKIEAPLVQGGFSLGSAVVVAPELAVTNCHVIRDAREVRVVRGSVRWAAERASGDAARDLCLLRVPGMAVPAVELGQADTLVAGQSVTALGYTGGMSGRSSVGEVVDLHRHGGSHVVQSSNRFSSGASGGALFDDAGRLVGVLTFRLRGGEEHAYSAPAEWVQRLLTASRAGAADLSGQALKQSLAYWQLDAAAQPAFLRAAWLAQAGRWSELAAAARAWQRDDRADAEPWYWLGVALGELGQTDDARAAFACHARAAPRGRPARAVAATAATPASAPAALAC